MNNLMTEENKYKYKYKHKYKYKWKYRYKYKNNSPLLTRSPEEQSDDRGDLSNCGAWGGELQLGSADFNYLS